MKNNVITIEFPGGSSRTGMLKSNFVSIVLICLMLMAGGCEKDDLQKVSIFRKVSVWHKGNIYAEGYLDLGKRLYHRVTIGMPDNPMNECPHIYLEWPDGEKPLLSDITVEMLAKMGNVSEDIRAPSVDGYRGADWPKGTKSLRVANRSKADKVADDAYWFTVSNNKIAAVAIFDYGCPGFWNESLTKRYTFPLTEKNIEELFGKPDEIIEYVPLFP
jgi:hypothetical protein